MKKFSEKSKKRLIIGSIAVLAVVILLTALTVKFYPSIVRLKEPEAQLALKQTLQSLGLGGVGILFAVQVLQVFSALIPCTPIAVVAGVTYGAWFGMLVCLSGIVAGSTCVFLLVKKYGKPMVDRMYSVEQQSKMAFLHDAKKLGVILFLIYFLPGMPKDLTTYLAALSPIPFKRFITIATLSRIPSILMSTFTGASFMAGDYKQTAVMIVIAALVGGVCMLFNKQIMALMQKRSKRRPK